VPMDEARAACAIDMSGRPYTAFEADFPAERVADFDTDLAEEFLRAVANTAKLTLHVRVEAGTNAHHMVEASFKAFARALREAVSEDPRTEGVPSTKGVL
jgi:imidazoleglycerol-phosphate dehydratase